MGGIILLHGSNLTNTYSKRTVAASYVYKQGGDFTLPEEVSVMAEHYDKSDLTWGTPLRFTFSSFTRGQRSTLFTAGRDVHLSLSSLGVHFNRADLGYF